MRKLFLALMVIAGTIMSLGGEANAAVLYGATGSGGAISTLYTINTATGAGTSIGSIGFNVSGIAFDPTTGILYGVGGGAEGGNPELIRIDTTTGAGTFIAGLPPFAYPDITFDSAGNLYGWNESSDDLVRINKTTGAITTIPSPVGTLRTGLAFDNSDTLYLQAIGNLYIIDPMTGAPTFVGSQGIGGGYVGMGMDFDENNNLYAIQNVSAGAGGARNLVRVNTANGQATIIGSTVAGLDALAFAPTAAVPEPATLTMFGLGALGLGFAGYRRGRAAR